MTIAEMKENFKGFNFFYQHYKLSLVNCQFLQEILLINFSQIAIANVNPNNHQTINFR